ncbi:acetyltransferase [Vibrio cholerae]|nr:acetyltransferase [Vibrio cholerae]EGR2126320.1 acetyltransferase [Vibrio cholerae]EJL6409486.1 acetyltransferase [Vibrio cholerae]EJL9428213.1 acetyltransferase [Vibrio cholerae]EKF9879137.1 acetyltransferase [Vibrio cholerae]MBS3661481.1 acetyltransferase [Vibrio cholerae]
MVSVVVFEFSVMRCQPLRRALCTFLKSFLQIKLVHSVIMR